MKKLTLLIAGLVSLANSTAALASPQMKLLQTIQKQVNREIKFVPEQGTADDWQIPISQGDCEDIALLKKQRLIQAGWDPKDLTLFMIYRQIDSTNGKRAIEGHIVLYVFSEKVILDRYDPRGDEVVRGAGHHISNDPQPWEAYMDAGGWKPKCYVKNETLGDLHNKVDQRCLPPQ